jgi:hypothetical protein
MKYASSIRYGGELIEAKDCDYESYKHLGLLCPECKDPVFLKAEGLRSLKDKDVRVGAHFSHFPGKDPAIVLACENRIKTYSKEDLERRANQSRGQRLKMIQRWLYGIIKHSPLFKEGQQKAEQLDFFSSEGEDDTDEFSKAAKKLFEERVLSLCEHIKQGKLKEAVSKEFDKEINFVSYLKDLTQKVFGGTIDKVELHYLTIELGAISQEKMSVLLGLTKIDRQMQKMICCEVLDFLSTPRARPILTEIFLVASALNEFAYAGEIPEDIYRLYEWSKDKGTTSCVCQIIVRVSWQSEFERMNQNSLSLSY